MWRRSPPSIPQELVTQAFRAPHKHVLEVPVTAESVGLCRTYTLVSKHTHVWNLQMFSFPPPTHSSPFMSKKKEKIIIAYQDIFRLLNRHLAYMVVQVCYLSIQEAEARGLP